MEKIDIQYYPDCIRFADDIKCGKVYPLSIAEQYQKGDIFAKTETEFKTVLFWHYSGFASLSGEYDESFLEFVYDLISDRYGKNSRRFILFNDEQRITDYFRNKDNIKIEQRYFFEYDSSNYGEPVNLQGDCQIKAIDRELISKINGRITPCFSWKSTDDFLSKGKGYCIVTDNAVAAWAFSAAISGEEIDIGVETDENYRGMGFAAMASKAMIKYILSENKKPVWACHSQNTASAKLADRIGFKKINECSVIKSREA